MKSHRSLLWLCWSLQALGYVVLGLWLMACPLLWIVRDGLGPSSVETNGWAAVWKFSPVLLVGLLVVCHLAVLHLCSWWLQRAEVRD